MGHSCPVRIRDQQERSRNSSKEYTYTTRMRYLMSFPSETSRTQKRHVESGQIMKQDTWHRWNQRDLQNVMEESSQTIRDGPKGKERDSGSLRVRQSTSSESRVEKRRVDRCYRRQERFIGNRILDKKRQKIGTQPRTSIPS